jgi:hypothetical protein
MGNTEMLVMSISRLTLALLVLQDQSEKLSISSTIFIERSPQAMKTVSIFLGLDLTESFDMTFGLTLNGNKRLIN